MRPRAVIGVLLASLGAAGCGAGPETCNCASGHCIDGTSCAPSRPPESLCLARLAAHQAPPNGCAIFAEGQQGDDRDPGTQERPVRTLARAVALARTGPRRIIAASALSDAVTLPSGIDLIGSFAQDRPRGGIWCYYKDCGWGGDARANIEALEPVPVISVVPDDTPRGADNDDVSTIMDMVLYAEPGSDALPSSIGIFVHSGTAVEIVGSDIRADLGLPGAAGQAAGTMGRAQDGMVGNNGSMGCTADTVPGGAAQVMSCNGIPTVGGKGGDGYADRGGDGEAGSPGPTPDPGNPAGPGTGGVGQRGSAFCQDGNKGAAGQNGVNGAAGHGIGRISDEGYVGVDGEDGGTGRPGQGGGGGGALRGGPAICGGKPQGGPSGGSGATGGCGGKGATAGHYGHGSFGILAIHARVTVRDTVITTQDGGDGGPTGKHPQQGGYGGIGSSGVALPNDPSTWSCNGGHGGDGGRGGWGGGGAGGPSIGIAYVDEDQLTVENVTFKIGHGGQGGQPPPTSDGNPGGDGIAAETFRFPE